MRYTSKTQYAALIVLSMIGMGGVFAAAPSANSTNKDKDKNTAKEEKEKNCSYRYKCDRLPDRTTNFWVSGDLLVWSVCEDGFTNDYGNTTINTNIVNKIPTTAITETNKDIDFEWGLGFRVGAGADLTCNGWDVGAFWTHFNADAENRSNRNSADWWLHFNTVDAVFGRKFWVGSCFNFRPFFGLRYAQINQRISTHLETDIIAATGESEAITRNKKKQRFWGVGPELGFDANFYFGYGWSIYGNLDTALLYGEQKTKFDKRNSFTLANNTCNARGESCANQWVVDAGLGVRWEFRYLTVQAGLEQHTYFDYNQIGCGGNLNLFGGNVSVAVHY